jgi:hypothetical protein
MQVAHPASGFLKLAPVKQVKKVKQSNLTNKCAFDRQFEVGISAVTLHNRVRLRQCVHLFLSCFTVVRHTQILMFAYSCMFHVCRTSCTLSSIRHVIIHVHIRVCTHMHKQYSCNQTYM